MESVKRTVKVTIEKEIEVELTPSVFGGMTEEQYLAEFRSCLWHVDGLDDVVKYAATIGAHGALGYQEDGLGLVGYSHSEWPRTPDTKIRVISEDVDSTILDTPNDG